MSAPRHSAALLTAVIAVLALALPPSLPAAARAPDAHLPAGSSAADLRAVSGSGFAQLWTQQVAGAEQLVVGEGATAVWAAQQGATGAAILARHYDQAGNATGVDSVVLADGIAGLGDWLAAPGRGGDVLVAWKAGGTVFVAGRTAAGGSVFAPVAACSDAAVAQARGAGAVATPVTLQADGQGGAYLLLAVTPSSSTGDSLLAHVSATGALAAPESGVAVAEGTAARVAVDGVGHLYALLTGPGRAGVALQRFGPELTADWAQPAQPYNPLAGPPSAAVQTPLGLSVGAGVAMAWRESEAVVVQRFNADGERLWLRPVAVKAAADAQVAGDGIGGVYITSAAGTSLSVAHVPVNGAATAAPVVSTFAAGRAGLRVDAVSSDASGDLDVAFSGAAAGSGGTAEMTVLGAWTAPALSPAVASFAALAADGSGGAYALETGAGGRLWHLGQPGAALTLRPRSAAVMYGASATASGYLTLNGAPLAGVTVRLDPSGSGATTDAAGFYQLAVKPDTSAAWTATAETPGGTTVSSAAIAVAVAPRMSLDLATRRTGKGYVTVFSGDVEPAHPGSTVAIQRRQGPTWRTLATGRLDAASSYTARWKLPLHTATYLFRAVLPAHADHAEGVSRTARLKVVVRPALARR